jgi:hypothetical protein
MTEIAKKPRERRPRTAKGEDLAKLRREIFQLRKAGWSFEDIGRKFGFANRKGPHWHYSQVLKEMVHEPAEEVRTLELERLDDLLARLWPDKDEGLELDVLDRILRIMERRAKLLGLDTIKSEGSMTHTHVHKHDHYHVVMKQLRSDTESTELFLRLAKRLAPNGNGNGRK